MNEKQTEREPAFVYRMYQGKDPPITQIKQILVEIMRLIITFNFFEPPEFDLFLKKTFIED